MHLTETDTKTLATRAIQIMADGTLEDFEAVTHPACSNREAFNEPLACRELGPAAVYATALWLRAAFSDLRWEVHEVVTDGGLVVVHATMSGRHTGDFVHYDAGGRPSEAFPPTGRTFATTQTHWFRVADGLMIEHWANRDDIGMAQQVGWVPPTPAYLLRMRRARGRARRSVM